MCTDALGQLTNGQGMSSAQTVRTVSGLYPSGPKRKYLIATDYSD